jgi:hypothetical protein
MHPEKRQQNAGLSLAEIHLHEETLPSVRSFAVSPKGCAPGGNFRNFRKRYANHRGRVKPLGKREDPTDGRCLLRPSL